MQHFIAFLLFFVLVWTAFCQGPDSRIADATDGHVHILSPDLIKVWKDLGIPFSRPDEYYSDIDAILANTGTKRIDLVSMAHVYSSEEFGKTANDREMVEKENAFVAAARDKHPKRIRAFCSVDPLRDYALEELERCRTKLKMDGIKLHHNANQVYLTVPEHLGKVKSVFEFAARHKLPILLHFDNSHRRFGKPDVDLLVGSILNEIGPVRLRIAHFGTSGGFSQRTRGFLNAFIDKFDTEPELKKHRITFDISAVALDKDSEGIRKLTDDEFAVLRRYIQRLGPARIAFGTDYPLYTAAEYAVIFRDRVRLTEGEIRTILKPK
ncbi:MAG: amidohydrolase family protein [Chloracidobacterium sp.]|nr:amidohydrolase family protein [Chloracidobacterium sp.]